MKRLIVLLALAAAPAFSATPPVSKAVACKEYGQVAREASGLIYQMNITKIIDALKRAHPTVPEEHLRGIISFVLTPPIVPAEASVQYIQMKCLELLGEQQHADERENRETRI